MLYDLLSRILTALYFPFADKSTDILIPIPHRPNTPPYVCALEAP